MFDPLVVATGVLVGRVQNGKYTFVQSGEGLSVDDLQSSFGKTVEIGRIVLVDKGKAKGELAAIVDVIDQNRVSSGVPQVHLYVQD